MKNETKVCQNCKNDFVIDPEDFVFYEKMKVPAPNKCPECRFKMRAVWRNEMSLYNRQCFVTGEKIISVYNPKSKYKVVSLDYYKSEDWDPFSFGIDYNMNLSFFDQLDNLFKSVYKKALFPILSVGSNVNSDYVNFAGGCNNSYMCFNTAYVENVMYSRGVTNAKDSIDLYYNDGIENCYECINVYKSHNLIYAQNSTSCLDSIFLENCHNCINCFGCVNLRNKSYCYFNEQYSKEEYLEKIEKIKGSFFQIENKKKEFLEFLIQFPKRLNQNLNTNNCTGEYIFHSKNCHDCFEIGDSEDSKFIFGARKTKDSYGSIGGISATESIENMTPNYSNRMMGTAACENSKNIFYSFCLSNCSDCIGCDSLKNSQYCILNKQYTKEQYEILRDHIIKELIENNLYGLMMPSEISPFAYNETIAQDNMPLTKEEAISQGYRWEDNIQKTEGKETLIPEDIQDHINDVSDEITKEILKCIDCQRNYKITDQELLLYRKIILPIPRKCFYCRHRGRIARRGPYKFWKKNCAHCNTEINTNYAPDRPEIVYCEKCYQQEVI